MIDPAVLSNAELFHLCATVFEEHAPSIFVYAKDGRRLIAELRKRGAGTTPPVREDVPEGGMQVVSDGGDVIVKVSEPRDRAHDDGKWLPNPRPGMTNIRISVVDEEGHVVDMEFGNATQGLAERVCKSLVAEHAKDVRASGVAKGGA